MEVIRAERLTKTYKDPLKRKKITGLQDLDLQINEGEIFGFIGPNGAGKSTAIKIFLNLIFPTAGKATLFGRDVSDHDVRRWVGYLPENPYFYDHLTPEEILWFGGAVSKMGADQIRTRTKELLELLAVNHARNRPLRTFSKGMMQRVGLALALINQPKLVILDEPMSGLDPIGRRKVADVIRKLKEEGRTVFLSSHLLHDVEDLCDRVGIIVGGQLRRLIEISEFSRVPPKGWRVIVKQMPDALSRELEQAGVQIRADSHDTHDTKVRHTEVQIEEGDIYSLLERFRKEGCDLVSIEPLRESLEDLFLKEAAQGGGSLQ